MITISTTQNRLQSHQRFSRFCLYALLFIVFAGLPAPVEA